MTIPDLQRTVKDREWFRAVSEKAQAMAPLAPASGGEEDEAPEVDPVLESDSCQYCRLCQLLWDLCRRNSAINRLSALHLLDFGLQQKAQEQVSKGVLERHYISWEDSLYS